MKNIFIMEQTMESTAHKIRKLYPEMGRAEKKLPIIFLKTAATLPNAP